MDDKPISYVFKICLVGSGAVGKTCMARRLCFDTFNAETQLTVGIDFYSHNIPIIVNGKETNIRLMIWDFGGQEQFKTLFNYYINGANGIFLVFDLSNLESLIKLEWWYEKLIQYNLQNHPKILVGTKLDLIASVDKKSKVDKYIIEKFLQKRNETDFVMTSSKENENILFSFKKMARKIMNSNNLEFDSIL